MGVKRLHGHDATGAGSRILGIGGSTRQGSRSLLALQAALAIAAEMGATVSLADVRTMALPIYDPDQALSDAPPAVTWLLDEVRAADAYLLCTPTYLGTIAGSVKNALDSLTALSGDDPPFLGGKPVGLIALGGTNATDAITALGHVTHSLNGLAVPTTVAVPGQAIDRVTGGVIDAAVRRRLQRMIGEVVTLSGLIGRPRPVDPETISNHFWKIGREVSHPGTLG